MTTPTTIQRSFPGIFGAFLAGTFGISRRHIGDEPGNALFPTSGPAEVLGSYHEPIDKTQQLTGETFRDITSQEPDHRWRQVISKSLNTHERKAADARERIPIRVIDELRPVSVSIGFSSRQTGVVRGVIVNRDRFAPGYGVLATSHVGKRSFDSGDDSVSRFVWRLHVSESSISGLDESSRSNANGLQAFCG